MKNVPSTIKKEIIIDISAEKAWNMFIDPSFTRQMGGEYISEWQDDSPISWKGIDGQILTNGQILKVEPRKFLKHSLFEPGKPDVVIATITYELYEEQGCTKVTINEVFTNSISEEEYLNSNNSWDAALNTIKELFEKNKNGNREKSPYGETAMLIRRPVSEVFDAFINPDITTKFWFTKSTGKLEKGKEIKWTWEMYNVSSAVIVKDIVVDTKIEIEWGGGADKDRTRVEWTFEMFDEHSTFVSIYMDGFKGDEKGIQAKINDSVGGFCWVLAGLKAYLEYNIQMNFTADRFPQGKH